MIQNLKVLVSSVLAISLLGLGASADAQRRGGGGGGGQQRGGGGQQRQAPPEHARREVVRTQNFPARSAPDNRQTNGRPQTFPANTGRTSRPAFRPTTRNTPQFQNQRKFTKTPQGRLYDNGLQLHAGVRVTADWQRPYFPHGFAHFGHYRPSYVSGAVFFSPFGFYYGWGDPFIDASICHVFPPSMTFIDEPVYTGVDFSTYADANDQNYFDAPDIDTTEPGLVAATNELTEAFLNGNIDSLVALVDPNVSIAVYERGKYRYSLASNDYVDLTRDAIQNTPTTAFNLEYLHRRSPTVFSVSGSQTYTAKDGTSRVVYVSFALQDIGGQWTLTQVGTAPDHYHSLR